MRFEGDLWMIMGHNSRNMMISPWALKWEGVEVGVGDGIVEFIIFIL